MQITLKVKTLKAVIKALGDSSGELGYGAWQFAKRRDNEEVSVDLSQVSIANLSVVRNTMKAHDEDETRRVSRLFNSLNSAETSNITKLSDFPRMFEKYIREQKAALLYSQDTDLRGVAYVPVNVEYHARTHRTETDYVTISLGYNTKMMYREMTLSLYQRDINSTIPEILRRKALIVPDEEMIAEYEKIRDRFQEYSSMHGEQFLCRGPAYTFSSRDYWFSSKKVDMSDGGKLTKAVMDFDDVGSDRHERPKNVIHSITYGKALPVPSHPVLPMFSLKHHQKVWVNVINMKSYKYEEDLKDKLVLPRSQVRLIGALVSNMDALRDENDAEGSSKTIKAKASSSVILSKGPAGTGKTLTAEVYAEEIKRPLYEVQSGQLGTDPEKLEERLEEVLARSMRLRMPLLINEADVFIQKRGRDVTQNAIVAVFLRLLEYHKGLLFLTTNRADDIDEAILSRCIAEIQYEVPEYPERLKLWVVLLKEFNVELNKKDLRRIATAFPKVVGRDIQNLIRLTNRYCLAVKEEFCLDTLRECAAFKSISYLNDEEIEIEIQRRKDAKAAKEAKEAKEK